MKKTFFVLALAMVLPALASSVALAAGGKIRFGNLAVVPSMGVDEVYNDNIYADKRGKTADWVNHVRPGVMLDYTIEGRGKAKLGYVGDYAHYGKTSENDWKNHRLFLDLNYLSPGGLILKIKNDLCNTEYPYGSKEDYRSGPQSQLWQDDLRTEFGFKFSDRFKLLTYYNYHRQDYRNTQQKRYTNNSFYYYGSGIYGQEYYYSGGGDFLQDYDYNEAGLGFETKVSHKTWAFLRYYTGSQNYFTHRAGVTSSNDSSYDWQRINTGLTWDDGGKFGGELNFGYQWNDHQNDHDQYGNDYKDKNNVIAATRVGFRQAEGRIFYFTATRRLYQLDAGSIGYYVNTAFGVGVEQRIKSKFFLLLGYAYEINKFRNEVSSPYYSYSSNRDDTAHHVRTALKYTIKEWLTATAEYNFMKNHSSDSWAGFTNNRFGISLDFKPAEYH